MHLLEVAKRELINNIKAISSQLENDLSFSLIKVLSLNTTGMLPIDVMILEWIKKKSMVTVW